MDIDKELNPEQAKAVRQTEGPVLILAGAGSGKTRTIVYRMAYLLTEMKVAPWNILAVTFTNKAAREMKDRIREMVGPAADQMLVSTFHSACVRILYSNAVKLGYPEKFEIADTTDQKSIIKNVYKKLQIDPKKHPEKMTLNVISAAKDELQSPEEFERANYGDPYMERIAGIYREYQKMLFSNGMMDFDDLIMNTVKLFRDFPEVLDHYQERFRYISVDEYQDTNTSQFELVRLLSEKYKNICVVGDDDQSIYRFRGANIYNILDFEKHFPGCFVVKLEENYRSTENILDAANAVIKHNSERKYKSLWTAGDKGDRIKFRQLNDPMGEASYIADEIRTKKERGERSYGDFAILTRTNIQSKELEDALRVRSIDYDVVKGLRFWDTKVIKDLTSYLLTVDNAFNDMRVIRIINLPKRGIGDASINKISVFAASNGMTFFDALSSIDLVGGIPVKAKAAIRDFHEMILGIRASSKDLTFSETLNRILEETGYMDYLLMEAETPERYKEEKEYIDKLRETLDVYEDETEEPDLTDFMRQNGLEGNNLDKEGEGDSREKVLIMTMHNAKGLEFPEVFMAGMEEGLFPGYASINSEDPLAIEEERRLCYVGITRARENLTLTSARSRMVKGEWRYAAASRFIKEIPKELLNMSTTPEATERKERVFPVNREEAERAFDRTPPAFSPGFKKRSIAAIKKGSEIEKVLPSYKEGDRVMHFKQGEGTVLSIKDGGRDYEVTVNFDKTGVRKMFAGFAKLKKI